MKRNVRVQFSGMFNTFYVYKVEKQRGENSNGNNT